MNSISGLTQRYTENVIFCGDAVVLNSKYSRARLLMGLKNPFVQSLQEEKTHAQGSRPHHQNGWDSNSGHSWWGVGQGSGVIAATTCKKRQAWPRLHKGGGR